MRSQRTKPFAASFVLVAGLMAASSGAAQDVNVDYDKQARFDSCATYAWRAGQPAQNPFADRQIVQAVDAALASKGWTKVQDNPGCTVSYQASIKEQRSLQVWQSGRFFGGMGSVDVTSIRNGMLVVDISDANGQLIWRAVAQDTLSDKSDKNQKKLAKSMEKMFKAFPPASANAADAR